MGILIALVPALGWGFQSIVMQKIGGKFTNKVMGLDFKWRLLEFRTNFTSEVL